MLKSLGLARPLNLTPAAVHRNCSWHYILKKLDVAREGICGSRERSGRCRQAHKVFIEAEKGQGGVGRLIRCSQMPRKVREVSAGS